MKISLECERCGEMFSGYGDPEKYARTAAAQNLASHLRWVHGKEMLEDEAKVGVEPWPDNAIPTYGSLTLVAHTAAQVKMLEVLDHSWDILVERSDKYHEAWLDRGAMMNMYECVKKMDRIFASFGSGVPDGEVDLDDCYDLINYMVAFISQANLGEWHGRG